MLRDQADKDGASGPSGFLLEIPDKSSPAKSPKSMSLAH